MSKSNRKRNKTIRDGRLAIAAPVNKPEPAMKAVLADGSDYNGSHLKGRKSLIEQCKTQGIWIKVLSYTRKYRIENPNTCYRELYLFLQTLFPTVFNNDEPVSSNIQKIVESDMQWSSAYWSCKDDIDTMIDLQVANLLQKEDLSESTVVKLYELQLKKKQAESLLNNGSADIKVEFSSTWNGGAEPCILD